MEVPMSGFIIRYTRLISGAAILAVFSFASSAIADQEVSSGIINVPNSPIVLTACKLRRNDSRDVNVNGPVIVGNRTKHSLARLEIVYGFYDSENVRLDQRTHRYSLETPIISGDTATVQGGSQVYGTLYNTPQLLGRVTCRVQSAEFSGNKHWQYGQPWNEKLVPLTTEQAATTSESGAGPLKAVRPQSSTLPKITVTVANSWNDTNSGITIVHDTLVITGGDSDVAIRGSNFALTMALANGAKKSFAGLIQQVPRYSRIDPRTGNTVMAFEVDPREDLGVLGTVVVPAHGTVRLTVSFIMQDALANLSDIRAVTIQ